MSPDLQSTLAIPPDCAGVESPPHTGDTSLAPTSIAPPSQTHQAVLRVLLYYDIWAHPLSTDELAQFFPLPLHDPETLRAAIEEGIHAGTIRTAGDLYFAAHRANTVVALRAEKERRARRYWAMARLAMHVIKRFPFVRAVLVSGELSKNVCSPGGDVDFFVLTEPGRLWLTRTLLIIFKKVFLLNSKKFFCLNYFASVESLEETERNVYVAAEVAHVKPLYNSALYRRYLEANRWIADEFPNLSPAAFTAPRVSERRSMLQRIIEGVLSPLPLRTLDRRLERYWKAVWVRRYAHMDREGIDRAFTSTASISRAYAGDFQAGILDAYRKRMAAYGLA